MGEPSPSLMATYAWHDGGEIGEYGWMTEIDSFEEEIADSDEPRDVLIERWERTSVEVRTLYPPLYACGVDLDCDEDAVAWENRAGDWVQVCEKHRAASTGSPDRRDATDG